MRFLSIIIPVYNVEKYIEQCFNSLIGQIDEGAEIICVDDGSTDKSGMICDAYAGKSDLFKVIHTANKGVAAACNIGLKFTQGKYIAWVDPDDYVRSNWYETITTILKSKEPDLLIFDYQKDKDGNGQKIIYAARSQYLNNEELLHDLVVDQKIQSQLWQKVFKRELLNGIIFPEHYKCMEDYAVLHKIIENCNSIYYLHEIIYCYRIRNDGLVKEVDLQKSYDCYLIAKERYEYLSARYENISRVGYLAQALGFCFQFCKCRQILKNKFSCKYRELCATIDGNIWTLFLDGNIGMRLKIKFICVYTRTLPLIIKFYAIIRGE
ncbi:MAG: glycosyltransferase [Phascolarctobacterium sp.]|nr:glycosyltransferase [Phascolarctobacterium sp.]